MPHGTSLRSEITAIGVEIRVLATGRRHNGRRLTGIDREFTRVFKTEMLQLAGTYAHQLRRAQKQAIVGELRAAEDAARQLRRAGRSAQQILQELEATYSAEAIRQRLVRSTVPCTLPLALISSRVQKLPPFETDSPEHQTFATKYPEPLAYERTGLTPDPTDGVDPRDLYSGQHSLAKQQGDRDEVPGYGKSWTARKAAIYGRPL